jgi:NADH:ubiquinone oxidoreductase subunit E
MLTIHICVGSSCYLKGCEEIVNVYLRLIEEYSLKDKVRLKGAFCLKNCSYGVTVKVEEETITEITRENCEQIFKEKVLGKLKGHGHN